MENQEQKFSYSGELKKQLEEDVWLRHLINKIRKIVVVHLKNGKKVRGVLVSIEYIRGVLNLEVSEENKTHFINWKYVVDLESERTEAS